MTFEPKALEVFQDCALISRGERPEVIREALLNSLVPPWSHSEKREKQLSSRTMPEADVLVLECRAHKGLASAFVALWSSPNGYEVSNIVPIETSKLSYSQYNAVLQDFVSRIAKPAAERAKFDVRLTSSQQSLVDWVSPEAATALRMFSAAANKSTGSSHPMDRDRWFKFIIAAHQSVGKLDASRLARWLHEADGWDDDSAHELAIEYEFGLALLDEYDRRRF
jgi:hypothetical protein